MLLCGDISNLRKKKLRSAKYIEVSLDEYIEKASQHQTDYDKKWMDKDHLDDLISINTLLKMTHWKSIKVTNGLFEDVERVFPEFWKLYKKELAKTNSVPRKGAMLTKTGDYKTSLLDFTLLVIDISKGKKPNTLSSRQRLGELERAGITEELILMELCYFEVSETLKQKERKRQKSLIQ